MTVQCPQCGTSFRLDDERIREQGTRARCAKCQHSFVVTRDPDSDDQTVMSPPPAAPTPEPPNPFSFDGESGRLYPPPPEPQRSIHEVQTAVFMVPEEIRAVAQGMPSEGPLDLSSDAAPIASEPMLVAPPGTGRFDVAAAPAEVDEADLVAMDEEATVIASPAAIKAARAASLVASDALSAAPAMSGGLAADGTFFPPADAAPVDEPKPVPPPGRLAAPLEEESSRADRQTAPVLQAPSLHSPASTGIRIATSVLVVALFALGVLLYLGGGRLDPSTAGLRAALGTPTGHEPVALGGVTPVSMRSVLYPTDVGREVLVFVGTAENRGAEARGPLDVVAELFDAAGNLLASARAPLGLALGPPELAALGDPESLRNAFHKLAEGGAPAPLPPGASAPFTVVLLDPPAGLGSLQHRVRLAEGTALAPPPPVDPVVEPEPLPLEELQKSKSKGKLKGKQGKTRRKGK